MILNEICFLLKYYKINTCRVHIDYPVTFIDLTGRIVSWSITFNNTKIYTTLVSISIITKNQANIYNYVQLREIDSKGM